MLLVCEECCTNLGLKRVAGQFVVIFGDNLSSLGQTIVAIVMYVFVEMQPNPLFSENIVYGIFILPLKKTLMPVSILHVR